MHAVVTCQYILQVLWFSRPNCETTWEPDTALSPSLVADYEGGIPTETTTEHHATYGNTCTTFVVKGCSTRTTYEKVPEGMLLSR